MIPLYQLGRGSNPSVDPAVKQFPAAENPGSAHMTGSTGIVGKAGGNRMVMVNEAEIRQTS